MNTSAEKAASTGEGVTVVSGVPRSGTSLLMQVLEAGGIPPLTDAQRAADADNPRGYYELEAVKRLAAAPEALRGARGRAVKVVHALLPQLPADHQYRVLFMRRDLREVVASQRAMLDRQGKRGAAVPVERLIAIFERQVRDALAWCAAQPNVQLLEVEHRRLCTVPGEVVAQIDAFLGGGLDTAAMVRVPEPALYRQRGA